MARTAAQKKAHAAGQKRIAEARKHIASGGSKTSWKYSPKKKSSGSNRQTTKTTTTKPTVSKVSKPSLIQKAQLNLLFILKSLLGRRFNKRMTVNVETVPRTIIVRGGVGPPKPGEIVVEAGPLPRVARYSGGGGGRKLITPIVPIAPTRTVTGSKRGHLSSGETSKLAGANTVTLYLENGGSRRVGSKLSRKIDGYFIIIKKNNKKVRIKSLLLTFNDALDLLAFKLDNNPSRVGEIIKAGPTNVIGSIPRNIKGYFVKNHRKFAIVPLRNGFNRMLIERKRFLNDKPGERKRRRKVVKRKSVKKKVIKRKKPIKRKRRK